MIIGNGLLAGSLKDFDREDCVSLASGVSDSKCSDIVEFQREEKLVKEEKLSTEKTEKIIEDYLFAEREPLRDEVLNLIEGDKPTILERKKVGDRILSKIVNFVETFMTGMNL